MRTFLLILKWDFILLAKYGILPIALAMGAIYIGLVSFFSITPDFICFLIFSDPSMFGFIFIGVMVLFEKQAGTSSALIVTPLKAWQYLLSKSLSLTILAIIISLSMVFAAQQPINYLLVGISVSLTSVLFLLLGFIGAQRVKTFNQYILVIPLFLAPLCIPLIGYFGLWESPFLWIIPTQSTLSLLKQSYSGFEAGSTLLAISILLISICLTWKWAIKEYNKRMLEGV